MKSAYRGLGSTEILLAVEALASLTAASLIIALLPFRTVTKLGARLGDGKRVPAVDEHKQALACCWAVEGCARRLPWRAVCFQQGLALQMMLHRRKFSSVMHYGVAQTQSGLKAHVWISVAGHVVLGGETAESFAELASFPAQQISR